MRELKTDEYFKALYPDELVARFRAGERNFEGVNLLRAELESIVGLSVVPFDSWYVPPALSSDETVRGPACPLWADRFGALTPPHSGRVTRYPERASGAFNALSEQLRTAGGCRHW
jgi:hypothetical protein